jgi:hypothetical protein
MRSVTSLDGYSRWSPILAFGLNVIYRANVTKNQVPDGTEIVLRPLNDDREADDDGIDQGNDVRQDEAGY